MLCFRINQMQRKLSAWIQCMNLSWQSCTRACWTYEYFALMEHCSNFSTYRWSSNALTRLNSAKAMLFFGSQEDRKVEKEGTYNLLQSLQCGKLLCHFRSQIIGLHSLPSLRPEYKLSQVLEVWGGKNSNKIHQTCQSDAARLWQIHGACLIAASLMHLIWTSWSNPL